MGKFELMTLPYMPEALEPVIDRETIALRNNIIAASKERIAVAKQVKEDLGVVKIKFPWC